MAMVIYSFDKPRLSNIGIAVVAISQERGVSMGALNSQPVTEKETESGEILGRRWGSQ